MLPRSGLLLADSKSNSSTRLPRRTTTRVSSGWEASMIILLAMANSLAARQNSPRGPNGPPECAARGVYAGDRENGKLGNERRRFGGLTIRDRGAKYRPRRKDCGREVLVSCSEHRHPENKAYTARRRSGGAAWRRCHDSGRAAAYCPAGRL